MHHPLSIGFLGVGFMGHGMASNIAAAGHALHVMAHRQREAVDDLVAKGATEVTSLQALADCCDFIVMCLTGSPQTEATLSAMRPHLRSGTTVIDCSTGEPAITRRLAEDLAGDGITLVDAPLGRTPKEAWAGTLDVYFGGSDAAFELCFPILDCFAGRIIHVGPTGAGHTLKLVYNFLGLGYSALYAEALAIAKKSGVETATVDAVLRDSRVDCGFYRTFMGYALDGDRDVHKFTLSNAAKDLRYAEGMANAIGNTTSLVSAVKSLYAGAVASGGDGPADYVPHLVDFVNRDNGAGENP